MTLLTINPDNHDELTSASVPSDPRWDKCMAANTSVHKYFDAHLPPHIPWAAQYVDWLELRNMKAQTDNGWWSLSAVNNLNIDAFVAEKAA